MVELNLVGAVPTTGMGPVGLASQSFRDTESVLSIPGKQMESPTEVTTVPDSDWQASECCASLSLN